MGELTRFGASAVGIVYRPWGSQIIKVRIPQIHGLPEDTHLSYYVDNNNLPEATIFHPVGAIFNELLLGHVENNEIVYVQFSGGDLAHPVIVGTTRNKYNSNYTEETVVLPKDQTPTAVSSPDMFVPKAEPSEDDIWSKYTGSIYRMSSSHYTTRYGGATVRAVVIHYTASIVTDAQNVIAFWEANNLYSSSNYIIDVNGGIAGAVPEQLRAYTSSSWYYSDSRGFDDIDNKAITIECSCNYVPPDINDQSRYTVSDATIDACVKLLGDIGNRYNITWNFIHESPSSTIHAHRWYAATPCPGDYLYSKFPDIAVRARQATEQEKQGG